MVEWQWVPPKANFAEKVFDDSDYLAGRVNMFVAHYY